MYNRTSLTVGFFLFITITGSNDFAFAKSEYKSCHMIVVEMPVRQVKNRVKKFLAKVNHFGKQGYKTFQIRFEDYYWAAMLNKCEK